MMTDDQLTVLAREYAEQTDGSSADIAYIKAIAENALRFLLRRYCLVEKERVKDEYEKAKADMVSKYHQGSMVVLQVLFPEIGKEVES